MQNSNVMEKHSSAAIDKRKNVNDKTSLPDKFYATRESPLTELFKNQHIKTLLHAGVSVLLALFINNVVIDYLTLGKINIGHHLITKGFAKFHIVILIWIVLFLLSLLCYPGFLLWANIRAHLSTKDAEKRSAYDIAWIWATAVYYFGVLLYIPAILVLKNNLPPVSSVCILMEQLRIVMKSHAFIRSNAPKILAYKPHVDENFTVPSFTNFIYFSFCPALVYQDSYPRTKEIRWKYVLQCFVEFFACILLMAYLCDRLFSRLENAGIGKLPWIEVVKVVFDFALCGLVIACNMNYLLLHSWLNAWAEMLRFGDRLFYKDWWTSTSYQRFYRTWNVVVHDWLYTYIYKDFYEILVPGNKTLAKAMVTLISSIFHEYFLSLAFKLFVPILFIQFFGFGSIMLFFKESRNWVGNVWLLYSYGLGLSWQMTMYSLEYMVRMNCPEEESTIFNFIVPRFARCDCFS